MGAVRMNITLPEETVAKLNKKVKPRNRSAVIAKALEEYFNKSERQQLVRSMIEGYKTRGSNAETDLWDAATSDGDDEY